MLINNKNSVEVFQMETRKKLETLSAYLTAELNAEKNQALMRTHPLKKYIQTLDNKIKSILEGKPDLNDPKNFDEYCKLYTSIHGLSSYLSHLKNDSPNMPSLHIYLDSTILNSEQYKAVASIASEAKEKMLA